jgi:hypothetical protein
MSRSRHPKKAVEEVVRYAEELGWEVVMSRGHIWGELYCHHHEQGGCIVRVFSTPRNPENHAKRLRREIDKCPHQENEP